MQFRFVQGILDKGIMQRSHDQEPAEVGHEVHLGVQGVTQECRAVRFLLHPIGVSALQALRETLGNELKLHSASGLVSYAAIADLLGP